MASRRRGDSAALVRRLAAAALLAVSLAAVALGFYLWASKEEYAYERAMSASLSGPSEQSAVAAPFDPAQLAADGRVCRCRPHRARRLVAVVALQLSTRAVLTHLDPSTASAFPCSPSS